MCLSVYKTCINAPIMFNNELFNMVKIIFNLKVDFIISWSLKKILNGNILNFKRDPKIFNVRWVSCSKCSDQC